MIAVIIPAHNGARRLGRCLRAVEVAVREAEQAGHEVRTLVVLDRCTDSSAAIARRHGVETLEVEAGNVGQARRAGATWMLEQGARWLACINAGSHHLDGQA